MPTLQELRKSKYPTIKAFAEALGVSPSKASNILQGAYISDYDDVVRPVADLLGIDINTCLHAMVDARNDYLARWYEKHPPTKTEAERDAELKAWCDARWNTATGLERDTMRAEAYRIGYTPKQRERRSPIEIMIDNAVKRIG